MYGINKKIDLALIPKVKIVEAVWDPNVLILKTKPVGSITIEEGFRIQRSDESKFKKIELDGSESEPGEIRRMVGTELMRAKFAGDNSLELYLSDGSALILFENADRESFEISLPDFYMSA